MITVFDEKWAEYKASLTYREAVRIMNDNSIHQPTIDKILKNAFEWAWDNKPQ